MVPVSHILWSHVWLGIATDAFDRARAFVRASAKRDAGRARSGGGAPVASDDAAVAAPRRGRHRPCRSSLPRIATPNRERLATMASALRFNNLKIAASEQAPRVCQGAMSVCGIVGFKNDTPYSVGRQLRDTMSGALMIANERIHQTNACLLLVAKEV